MDAPAGRWILVGTRLCFTRTQFLGTVGRGPRAPSARRQEFAAATQQMDQPVLWSRGARCDASEAARASRQIQAQYKYRYSDVALCMANSNGTYILRCHQSHSTLLRSWDEHWRCRSRSRVTRTPPAAETDGGSNACRPGVAAQSGEGRAVRLKDTSYMGSARLSRRGAPHGPKDDTRVRGLELSQIQRNSVGPCPLWQLHGLSGACCRHVLLIYRSDP